MSFLSSEKHNRINLTGVFWQQRGGNQSGFGSQGETTSFTWRKKRSSHTASVRLLERGNEKLRARLVVILVEVFLFKVFSTIVFL